MQKVMLHCCFVMGQEQAKKKKRKKEEGVTMLGHKPITFCYQLFFLNFLF
jgi:uncharacterized membrane protein